jgi:mono/diheme cytochrome c family protein
MASNAEPIIRESDYGRILGIGLVLSLLASGLLLLSAYRGAGQNPQVRAGQAVFSQHCQSCHGVTAQGLNGLGVALEPSAFVESATHADLVAVVRGGRTGTLMAGFNGVLTDQQLNDVAVFLRELQSPAFSIAFAGSTPTLGADHIRGDCWVCHQGRVKPLEPRPPDDE